MVRKSVEEIFRDVRARELPRTVRDDARALYLFYLDEERRAHLASMHGVRRAVWMPLWFFRGLLLRLTPGRRLLLVVALALALIGRTSFRSGDFYVSLDLTPWAFLILLFVLALELKDKLLARDEIAVARQVQLALLPSQDPAPPGYALWSHTRPANDVGGDLVDYIDSPSPGATGVVLGDVSGKGLGAALLMAKLQASLRAIAPGCPGLGDLGARLNGILCRDGLDNRFATLFYMELPPAGRGPVRFLNAGHNPPIRVHAGGTALIEPSSRPLGMFADSVYEESSLALDPDDLLIVYSDGLVEATDAFDVEFGLERLRGLARGMRGLPPAEAGRRLLLEIDRFLGDRRPHDDLSLILVRRTP